MAEAAGLVLGVIPLVIWALEKYAEPLEVYTDYHNHIQTFRSDLKLQEHHLHATLSNIGLDHPTKDELRACVESKFPAIADEVLHIIQDMETVMATLMRKLGIDFNIQMDAMPHSSWFQLRRIRNSVNTKRREAVIDRLRKRNADLCRCLQIDKSEVKAEDDSLAVLDLHKRFQIDRCNALRLCLGSLYRALASGLCCTCPAPHHAALDLDWQLDKPAAPPDLNIVVSYQDVTGNMQQSAPFWRRLQATPKSAAPTNPAPTLKLAAAGNSSSSGIISGPSTPPRTPSPRRYLPSRARVEKPGGQTQVSLIPATTNNILIQPLTPPDLPAVPGLCGIFTSDTVEYVLQDDDQDHGRDFALRHNVNDKAKFTHLVPIKSLCRPQNHQKLSLKTRCGLAAYAAMSVLHLSSGPWLGDNWDERQVGIFLQRRENDGEELAERPCFLYDSVNSATLPWTLPDGDGGDGLGEVPVSVCLDALAKQLVPNLTVFSLGILLVELCVGKPCENPKEDEQRQQEMITDRYASAMRNLDEVYALAGNSYGDAAKKCIKFSFPGKDTHNTFEMEKFRVTFYRQVVAPVQATYAGF